jgi:hypothetical protein
MAEPLPSAASERRPTDPPPYTAPAMACAIIALFTWWLPPISGGLAVLALILAWLGGRSARAEPGKYLASMLPTATRVCAYIALVLAGVIMLLWLLIAAALGGSDDEGHGDHGHAHPGEDEPQLW